MSCQKIVCGSPQVLPFTRLTGSATESIKFGDEAKYQCFEGHTELGKPDGVKEFSVKCQENGRFSAPKVCEPIRCGRAPSVPKSRAAIAGEVSFGMHLEHLCDTGYTLDGTIEGKTVFKRDCQHNGKFSDLASPQPCKPISAGKAPIVKNAVMSEYAGKVVESFPPTVEYPNGLEYRCQPGFTLTGSPNGPTKISAKVNSRGQITPDLPSECQAITYFVHGQVHDARSGEWLSGVKAKIVDTGISATSDGGFFWLAGVTAGHHTIVYSKSGYAEVNSTALVVGLTSEWWLGDISM